MIWIICFLAQARLKGHPEPHDAGAKIMRRILLAAGILMLAVTGSVGQTSQPYAGLQPRGIKALSDQQIADLRAGRGMGLALAAELNGYPGPMHVLELADKLALRPEQQTRIQQLYEAMKAEAVPIGEQLIAQETGLDRQFADRVVTPASLTEATAAIGQTQAALRLAHLRYHLATIEVLDSDQVRLYSQLRGYAGDGHGSQDHRRRHPSN
jgi:hypothetical protein